MRQPVYVSQSVGQLMLMVRAVITAGWCCCTLVSASWTILWLPCCYWLAQYLIAGCCAIRAEQSILQRVLWACFINLIPNNHTNSLQEAAASCVEKVDGAESCNFPTDNCKFLTEKIMDTQNFRSAPKFPAQNFHFWTKIFGQEQNFLTAKNLGEAIVPCHDATGKSSSVTWLQLVQRCTSNQYVSAHWLATNNISNKYSVPTWHTMLKQA